MERQRTQLALKAGLRSRAVRGWNALRGAVVLGVMMAVCLEGGCRTEQSWPLWESYARSAFDDSGRIVDHSAGDRTTSEGQAYGMFFALVANDRARFTKLLSWTQDNLAGGDLAARLPAWSWGKAADGSWKILDQNPASDADLWMAYALLEAGRLWHESRYERLGTAMASHIAQQEVVMVPRLGTTLLPGPQGFHPDAGTWILNPSYLQPSVLSYLAATFPQGPWGAVLASLAPILTEGSGGGFAMNWVMAGGSLSPAVSPAKHETGDKPERAEGSYDAIRVYLWLGIADPQTQGVQESLAGLRGMAAYMKHSAVPPRVVDEAGSVTKADGPVGFSAAVVPYLNAINMKAEEKTQADRVAAMKSPSSGLYGPDALYYDQNLVLFANGWMEERFRFERLGRLKVKWR
jgi:endo-1,4-beta-D-glucanase Y